MWSNVYGSSRQHLTCLRVGVACGGMGNRTKSQGWIMLLWLFTAVQLATVPSCRLSLHPLFAVASIHVHDTIALDLRKASI